MYVYGQLTAPNPDRRAMRVTPITPTRLMSCSMDKIPENSRAHESQVTQGQWLSLYYERKHHWKHPSLYTTNLYKPKFTKT